MKPVLLTVIVLLTCTASHCQMKLKSDTADIDLGMKYKQKSANTKAVGFVFLVTGLTLTLVSAATLSQNLFSERDPSTEIMAITGLGMAVSSIPLFVIASKQKYKSRVLLSREKTSWDQSKHNTAIALRVAF